MVPTFCVEELEFGSAKPGEGDLPLFGVGGGEPKRESWSSSAWLTVYTAISVFSKKTG